MRSLVHFPKVRYTTRSLTELQDRERLSEPPALASQVPSNVAYNKHMYRVAPRDIMVSLLQERSAIVSLHNPNSTGLVKHAMLIAVLVHTLRRTMSFTRRYTCRMSRGFTGFQ